MMDVQELVARVQCFHREDRTEEILTWSSDDNRRILGEDWGGVEIVDSSDYNYDFCDTFDFVFEGRTVVSVDISHVAPVFRITGWGVRKKRQHTSTHRMTVANETTASVRATLRAAGLGELSASAQGVLVDGVALELSEQNEVTLGKCLFKDYDGPAAKGDRPRVGPPRCIESR